MRVALYSRVSSRDGKQDCENQLIQLRDFIARQGWELVQAYVDYESGKSGEREQFKLMLLHASQRRFDLLCFWSLDRLTREGAYETLNYLRQLSGWGIGWRSYTEPFLDSTGLFRDALIALLGALARLEREKISERTRAGLQRARREGKILGRPRVKVPRSEIRLLRAQGLSWTAIAKQLNLVRSTVQRACEE